MLVKRLSDQSTTKTPPAPWIEAFASTLVEHYGSTRLPSALLFELAVPEFAEAYHQAIIQRFLCKKLNTTQAYAPCNQCSGCLWFLSDTHPNAITVRAEEATQKLGLDRLQASLSTLFQTRHQLEPRVVSLILQKDMTEAAMQSLLKVIEEPPEKTHFFIFTARPERLLETIRSRCVRHLTPMPNESTWINWMQGQTDLPAVTLKTLFRLSALTIEKVRWTLQAEQTQRRKSLLQDLATGLKTKQLFILFKNLNLSPCLPSIAWLLLFWSDLAKLKYQKSDQLSHLDLEAELNVCSEQIGFISGSTLLKLWDATLACHEMLFTRPEISSNLQLASLLVQCNRILNSDHH